MAHSGGHGGHDGYHDDDNPQGSVVFGHSAFSNQWSWTFLQRMTTHAEGAVAYITQ